MAISNSALNVPRKNTAAVVVATFAKIGTNDFEVTTAGDGEQVLGIFYETQSTVGKDVAVSVAGITRLTLGNNAVRGDKLDSDSLGYGRPTITDGAEYGAIALQSGTTGDIIEVLVVPASTLSVPV